MLGNLVNVKKNGRYDVEKKKKSKYFQLYYKQLQNLRLHGFENHISVTRRKSDAQLGKLEASTATVPDDAKTEHF